MKQFTHLHNHSEYSILDGAAKIDEMVAQVKKDGGTALGITDHGALYGLIEFYKSCTKAGINPVLGMEAYFTDNRLVKETVKQSNEHGEISGSDKRYYHLTLLAETNEGYHNLIKVSSDAFLKGHFYKPRADWDSISEFSKGLIATSGCLGGPVLQKLLYEDFDGGLAVAGRLQDIFGKDNFFIELMNHGIPEQARTNPLLIEIGKRLDAPLVATQDVHYIDEHAAKSHDILLCCQTGALQSDENRFKFSSDQHYLKTAEEMYGLFKETPIACDNTMLIAERANVKIDFSNLHLPEFPIPENFNNDVEYLVHLVAEGIKKVYPNADDTIWERAEYELGVFQSMGVSSYMLILWDLMRFAREEGIFTPPGRGSAAGCLCSYVLGITKVDPIKYDLIFERFLNPSRVALPDVDIDIEQRYREKLINYTIAKYGADHVAQIITFNTIKARTAVRDSARVLGYAPNVGDRISKLMPPPISGVDTPLAACFKLDHKYEGGFKAAQGLRQLYEADPGVKEIVDAAVGIEGLIKSTGVHAAGVVIGDAPLDEIVPITLNKDGLTTTQWGKKTIEALGLVKMDYLGLKNLDILADTQALIGDGFKVDDIPMDDPATFELLRSGNVIGCFQIESSGMRSLLRKLGPSDINDISAVLALYRPGPMAQNWHNDYADRKNGRQASVPFHPDAEDILKSTFQLCIYQEQILKIANTFAGYSLTEADNLRRIIGHKEIDEMTAESAKFIDGCISQGYSEEFSKKLFEMIDGFSLYGFNRCLTGDTIVTKASGNQYDPAEMTLKDMYERVNGPPTPWKYKFKDPKRGLKILAMDDDGRIRPQRVKSISYMGEQPVFEITLSDGKSIKSTGNHRHHGPDGWVRTDELSIGDDLTVNTGFELVKSHKKYDYSLNSEQPQKVGAVNGAFGENNYAYAGGGFVKLKEWTESIEVHSCEICGESNKRLERAHLDGNRKNNEKNNLKLLCVSCHKSHDYEYNDRNRKWQVGHKAGVAKIVSIQPVGVEPTYDLEMDFEGHNFVANGIVTHNSHSVSYAFITYWTAYLKTHYPRQYMAALCTGVMDELDDTAVYLNEVRRMGLKIYPPDLNKSKNEYTVEEDGIRIGLNTLKGVGESSTKKIIVERDKKPFTDLYDFAVRVNPNVNTIRALAWSGAMEQFGTRQGVGAVASEILAASRKAAKSVNQESLFDLGSVSDFKVPKSEFQWHQLLIKEKETLGLYISGHPLTDYQESKTDYTISSVKEIENGKPVKVLAIVDSCKLKYTKKQETMAILQIEDETGTLEVVVFPKQYEKCKGHLMDGAILEVNLRPGTDYQDEKNYILLSAKEVASKVQIDNGEKFGVFLPKGFNSNSSNMSRLKGIFLENPGNVPVDVYISRSTVIQLDNPYLVSPGETLVNQIKNLFKSSLN